MPAHRFYADGPIDALASGRRVFSGDEARHAVVKRLTAGERVEVLDGAGRVGVGVVESIRRGTGKREQPEVVVLIERVDERPPVRPAVQVWAAAPKGDRLAWMIEQLAQAGAARVGLVIADRSVSDASGPAVERLNRIAREAGKQSGRAHAMIVDGPRPLAGLVAEAVAPAAETPGGSAAVLTLFADACGAALPALWPGPDAVGPAGPTMPGAVRVFVGPEGGWSEAERQRFSDLGVRAWRLGPHVLRVETAAVLAAGLVLAHARA